MKTTCSWDIFCRVIDNHGDIGVTWRLAAELAARGHRVRLWTDDARALAWMAPGAESGAFYGVQVLPWAKSGDATTLAVLEPAEVWIEGFGCELEPAFVAQRFAAVRNLRGDCLPPVWINLEYLSAEPFATRAHGLPSPILQGPAAGHTRWFFYPGFTEFTGGLVREDGLTQRWLDFDRASWLARQGIDWAGEHLVSLFCYEPAALPALLGHYQTAMQPTRLLVTAGRAASAVRQIWQTTPSVTADGHRQRSGALTVDFLPNLTQPDYDHLLWASDMNFVRGEDSLVRSVWAARPFVWQIYPQDDDAHHAKLDALLDALDAPASLRAFHLAWNGVGSALLPSPQPGPWGDTVRRARDRLVQQPDLTTRLVRFVQQRTVLGETGAKDR